jgi:hypothetical protein
MNIHTNLYLNHMAPSQLIHTEEKANPADTVEAEVLFEDFVAYMGSTLSSSVSNAIMLAALQQPLFAQQIVTDQLARIARRRKGRIDSDKTRLAAHGIIVDMDWPKVPVKQSVATYAKDNGQGLGYASVTLCELKGVGTTKGKPGVLYLVSRPTALHQAHKDSAMPNSADMHVFTAHAIDRLVERVWGAHEKNRTEALLALRHIFVRPLQHPAVQMGNLETGELLERIDVGQEIVLLVGSMYLLQHPATGLILPFFFIKTILTESMLSAGQRQKFVTLGLLGDSAQLENMPTGWWRREIC